jgi:hypothetical protein
MTGRLLGSALKTATDVYATPVGHGRYYGNEKIRETAMRTLLALLGIIVIIVVVLMALGFINIDQTRNGKMPSISVQGGQAPAFQADVGSVDVGTENKTVQVPTVDVTKPGDNTSTQ